VGLGILAIIAIVIVVSLISLYLPPKGGDLVAGNINNGTGISVATSLPILTSSLSRNEDT
jgi:hypothetical protein